MEFNYSKICDNLIKDLPGRSREIIEKRFGLKESNVRTLESIGKEYDITRERVRQIEKDAMELIRERAGRISGEFFQYMDSRFRNSGGLKKEEKILSEWEDPRFRNYVLFLLSSGRQFKKFKAANDFYPFWAINLDSVATAKEIIKSFLENLKKEGHPISVKDYRVPHSIASSSLFPLTKRVISTYIEISKHIVKSHDGLYGLPDWPEIRPRGIKDKAYLIFRKVKKPLHFTQAAALVNNFSVSNFSKENLVQSVHNELIRDPRFVLVGRGLYGLREWGYTPGVTKEVILRILDKESRPMSEEQIIERVLEQRKIKKSTILMGLKDKRYFLRNDEGKYLLQPGALRSWLKKVNKA